MSSQLPPINNPYQSSAPQLTPEPYAFPDKSKGIKTVSVLFIVFGILGLLTLPGLILGAVIQLLLPQWQGGGQVMLMAPAIQTESAPNESDSTKETRVLELPDSSDSPSETADSQGVDFQSDMNSRMMEIQRFNPLGFGLGLVNIILSGCLLWSGLLLIKFRLTGALFGRKVCLACMFFEVARMIFGVWTAITVARLFHGIETPDAETPFPIETVMIGSMIFGMFMNVIYGTAKIVMYLLCYRYLGQERIQAQLS